jgi:hypothetical protein
MVTALDESAESVLAHVARYRLTDAQILRSVTSAKPRWVMLAPCGCWYVSATVIRTAELSDLDWRRARTKLDSGCIAS